MRRSHKTVILSEAPHRSIAQRRVLWRGVEGPRRSLLADALRSFPATSYKGNQKSHQLRTSPTGVVMGLWPTQGDEKRLGPATTLYGTVALSFVIPKRSALYSLGCFSSKLPQNRHPERSASQIYCTTERFMARSRRTPAMPVGRCSSELSGHKLQGKSKKSQAERSAPHRFIA